MVTVPASGDSNPATSRNSVVLPHPDAPTTAVVLPAATSRSMWSRTVLPLKAFASATNTNDAAAAAAGAVRRRVTRKNVALGDTPSDRDASSRLGGTWARPARTLTNARGMNNRTYANTISGTDW